MTARVRIVADNTQQVLARYRQAAAEVTAKIAQSGKERVAAAAPKKTGYLASTVDAKQIDSLRWLLFVGALYAHYVEYGTSRMGAQPYFWPVVEMLRQEYISALRVAFRSL